MRIQRAIASAVGVLWVLPLARAGAAEFTVKDQVVRPAAQVPPLGANDWGRVGAIEYAANNFVDNSGNEPIYWRGQCRVTACGDNWFEIDGGGVSWWDLWASGFLSGADLRIYRLVDKDGKSLSVKGNYLDISKADHPVLVGKTQVIPAGSPGYPDGGWVVGKYCDVHTQGSIRNGNLTTTDTRALLPGRTYYYAVVAVGPDGQESDLSNEASGQTGNETRLPHIIIGNGDDKLPALRAGQAFDFTPKAVGGALPLTWSATGLPQGLRVNPATGQITGQAQTAGADVAFELRVTDASGQADSRRYILNPAPDKPDKTKPQPPTDVVAKADGQAITLSWKPSPSPNVAFYRLKRATMPRDKQVNRVHVVEGSPKIEQFDYIMIEKRSESFDMNGVSPRVRGIGNPINSPNWWWNVPGGSDVSFALAEHGGTAPAEMIDPGETYLQVTANPGRQTIRQIVFIGTEHGGESLWYGQLEPGRKYRAEFWLKQDGLANGGKVTFSYGAGYPGIRKEFAVTSTWAQHTHEFVGPDRPRDPWHFGHQLEFAGPGTLSLDNCRILRVDDAADADRLYVPNATVFDEFVAAQPQAGPKGSHRIWFLNRHATMSSILSWHANSCVSPDWHTSVGATMQMTLPMALMFDERTGQTPQQRVRPWIVIQHMLHTEQDWQNLVEYLAAPYDVAKDSPQSKPWAYRRYQQRGNATPWTDTFDQIIVEFGNETWHNGVFPDWIGFAMSGQVHQGGREYGLFTRYLVENIRKSPYWASQKLEGKIRFNLGANYSGTVEKDGAISGYGEDAMKGDPYATVLGHANYVGPKWETGEEAAKTYTDDGVQATLLAYVQGLEPDMQKWGGARDAMAKQHHAYDLAAYEGGPSGYTLPGSAPEDVVEVNEKYGKSLAMAVASLDAWMSSYRYGYTYQNFLGYGQGRYWNSHTLLKDGFRPSPGWLALTLRNRYASGDLMAVDAREIPTIKRGKGEYPVLGCYAMRDGKRWSVFVVSRQLEGALPLALKLPFASATKVTLHQLAGDPRLTNRDKMNVAIQSEDLPSGSVAGGTMNVTMPAGSIYLFNIEAQ